MRNSLLKILLQWGLALLLIILLFLLGDVSQLTQLSKGHWGFVLLVFLSNVGFTLAHNFRWKEIVDSLSGQKGSHFFPLYRSLVNSYAVGKIIPMDISLLGLRSLYLTRVQNLSISSAIFSVLLDRFLDIILFSMIALPSLLFISKTATLPQSTLVFILFLIFQGFIIFWKKGNTFYFFIWIYQTFLLRWLSRIPLLRGKIREGMESKVETHYFQFAAVLRIMIWNYAKYVFLCLRFFFTGLALGIHFPLFNSFYFMPLIQLSGLINITPGGLGVVELGTYGTLLLMGIPKPQVLVFVFGQRVLLFFMFLCLLVLNYLFSSIQTHWWRFRDRESR